MKRISELMRERLLKIAPDIDSKSYPALKISEWESEFEQLMRNRLIMGSIRYERMLHDERPPGHTPFALDLIRERLAVYERTGNREMLVDVANISLVEFLHSDHPLSHFEAQDRK